MKGNNTWEVLKCYVCNSHHAQPMSSFKSIYEDSTSKYTCPYCGNVNYIYGSKCGKMLSNRYVTEDGKMSEEVISIEDKLAYTE